MSAWGVVALAALVGVWFLLRRLRRLFRRRAYRKLRPSPAWESRIRERAERLASRIPHSLLAGAIVTPDRVLARQVFGREANDFGAAPEHLRFEIGSVTKVFTALLLARLDTSARLPLGARLGGIAADWFPPGSPWAGLTLEELATHTGGLPRLPPGFLRQRGDLPDPYAGFDLARLRSAMATHAPRQRGRGRYRYSNFGFGLLGELCARAAGQPFPDVLRAEILDPLGLHDTDYRRETDLPDAVVPGRRRKGHVAPAWHFDAFAGAGGLVSSLHDLARLLQLHLRPTPTWRPAVEACLQPRARASRRRCIGLAWHCDHDSISGQELWWHNGATAGYRAFVGMVPAAEVGVVWLSNSSPFDGWTGNIDQLGVESLRHAMKRGI